MNATDTHDIWAMLEEDAPNGCAAVQDLYSWSLNYDAGKGPMTLYLDLIGWSADNIGEALYDTNEAHRGLGYVEIGKLAAVLGKLAAALTEYADRPNEVREYVDTLLEAETAE